MPDAVRKDAWQSFVVLLLSSRMLHETTVWDPWRPDGLIDVAAVFVPLVFRFHWLSVVFSLGVNLVSIVGEMPYMPNHTLLALFVTVASSTIYLRHTFGGTDMRALAPSCGAALAWVYLWAGFHKLNVDFFNPEVSCVNLFTGQMWPAIGLSDMPPPSPELLVILAAGTVALELGAGLLLFSRTLAWLGAALALLLHVPLSFAGFFNFASLAFAVLYLLILPQPPATVPAEKKARYRGIDRPVFHYAVFNSVAALIALVVATASEPDLGHGALSAMPSLQRLVAGCTAERLRGFRTIVLLLSTAYVFWPWLRRPHRHRALACIRPTTAVTRGCFAAFALYGATSYLGLSTAANFSMFSNLRTEGPRSNHLLLASQPLKLFDYQQDLVEIISIGDAWRGLDIDFEEPAYRGGTLLYQSVNLLQFRYLIDSYRQDRELEQMPMVVRYQGRVYDIADIRDDPFFAPPRPGALSYLMMFRPVYSGTSQQCLW